MNLELSPDQAKILRSILSYEYRKVMKDKRQQDIYPFSNSDVELALHNILKKIDVQLVSRETSSKDYILKGYKS